MTVARCGARGHKEHGASTLPSHQHLQNGGVAGGGGGGGGGSGGGASRAVRCTVGRDTPVIPPPTHSDWPWALGGCVVRRRAAVRAMVTIADARAGAKASEIADARPVGPTCVRGARRGGGGSTFPGARQSLMACPTAQGVQRSCTPSRQAAPTHAGKRETHVPTHTAWGGVEGGVEHQQFCALSTRRLRGLWVTEAPLLVQIWRPIPPSIRPRGESDPVRRVRPNRYTHHDGRDAGSQ